MNILYDHQIFTWQKYGGISRYFYELMRHFTGLFDYDVSGVFSENEYMKTLGVFKNFPVKSYFKGKSRLISAMNKMDSMQKIRNRNYDVLHPTYYDPYIINIAEREEEPLVITVYDMIHEKFPEYFLDDGQTVSNKKKMIQTVKAIIAISENTKKDILSFYPEINETKITVTHLGISFEIASEHKEKENYILFVGQRGAYKNWDNFIEAVAPLLIQHQLKLICTGGNFNKQEGYTLQRFGIEKKAICKPVTEIELRDLYERAIVFVFPSLYEGFGIPVLEAFACGCPAVLANTSSLPEVGGDAAVYFDPHSIEGMRAVIEKVILSESLREELAEKGKQRARTFSWRKCAEETAKVYAKVRLA